MTDLSVRLELAAVRDCPEVSDKADILRLVARVGQACYGLDADATRAGLVAREELGSTGFGRSIAIPHTKLPDLDHCVGIFLSRFLRDDHMVAKLRGASGQDALYALLNRQREQQAA